MTDGTTGAGADEWSLRDSPKRYLCVGGRALFHERLCADVQFEDARHHDYRLPMVAVLEHRILQGFGTADKQAADAAGAHKKARGTEAPRSRNFISAGLAVIRSLIDSTGAQPTCRKRAGILATNVPACALRRIYMRFL